MTGIVINGLIKPQSNFFKNVVLNVQPDKIISKSTTNSKTETEPQQHPEIQIVKNNHQKYVDGDIRILLTLSH